MEQDTLQLIWNEFSSEIASGVITLLIAFIINLVRPKVSLIWGQANHSWHSIPVEEGDIQVISEKNFLQNMGKAPATDVEVIYQSKPTKLLIFPTRDYEASNNPDGAYVVKIPYISPQELITLDGIFINESLGHILNVKCKERFGKKVNFWVIRRLPKWAHWIVGALLIFGVAFLLSTLIKVVV